MQFYPNFAPFSTLGGMNLNHNFFQASKLSEDQKKIGLHQKWNHFSSPNSAEDQKKRSSPKMEHFFRGNLGSDAHQSQIFGEDADEDHTQIIGGDTVKLLEGIYPLIPPGFRHPCLNYFKFMQLT